MLEDAARVKEAFGRNVVAKDGQISAEALATIMTALDSEIGGSLLAHVPDVIKSAQGMISIDGFVDWVYWGKVPSATVVPAKAQIMDGNALSEVALRAVKDKVDKLLASGSSPPHLVVVLVGSNAASNTYIKRKEAAAAQCGIRSTVIRLDGDAAQAAVLAEVERLNSDPSVHGILVQLPLPPHLDAPTVTGAVLRSKDVDGLTPDNVGSLALSGYTPAFYPCTPKGCMRLLESLVVPLRGKVAVIVGASNIVGIPMMLMLLKEGCTVNICHIDTVDVAWHARTADILIVAVGKAGLVRANWVKPGAIVIDVGINFVPDPSKKAGRRMVGDVEFDEVCTVAGHITPVPGGVGPMTVAMLMENTFEAHRAML